MKEIAIFDLDGTIDRADTFVPFLVGVLLRSPRRWWRLPILVGAFVLHHIFSFRDRTWLKSFFLENIIGYRDTAPIDAYARVFANHRCKKFCNLDVLHEINRLRPRVKHLAIATASPDVYVKYIAAYLAIPEVISTQVATNENGEWTGSLVDGNCHGERKRELITQYLLLIGGVWDDVVYYSDHHSDLPTFKKAGKAIAVNPTAQLKKILSKYGIFKL